MEFLKDVLGEELYAAVSEKLNGNDKIRIVNAADGTWIPKEKLDAELGNVKTLRKQINDLNGQLTSLQTANSDNETLKSQITQMQADIAKKDEEMQKQSIRYQVKDTIRASKAKNADVVLRMVDMDKVSVNDGKLEGLDDQIDALKKSDAYLFEDAPSERGGVPSGGEPAGKTGTNADMNAFIRSNAHG